MPITIDEFEEGDVPAVPGAMERALAFLYANRDRAFTPSEVAAAIEEDVETTAVMLDRLRRHDVARNEGDYWAVVRDTDRVTAEYDVEPLIEQYDF